MKFVLFPDEDKANVLKAAGFHCDEVRGENGTAVYRFAFTKELETYLSRNFSANDYCLRDIYTF